MQRKLALVIVTAVFCASNAMAAEVMDGALGSNEAKSVQHTIQKHQLPFYKLHWTDPCTGQFAPEIPQCDDD